MTTMEPYFVYAIITNFEKKILLMYRGGVNNHIGVDGNNYFNVYTD